jgi:carboxypeptidase D
MDHLVTDLPLLDKTEFPTDHWAGLLPASDGGDKYLFYWLFAPSETESKADKDIPLIIWLNGGPACSSMDGLWLENGPFRLQQNGDDWTIDIDKYSWHTAPAYVVYIDQPVGTGIAFTTSGKYPTNDKEVNVDFYYFLEEFLQLHANKFLTEDSTTLKRPLYFAGESHAGHYIPSMMNYIRKQNGLRPKITIPLAGAAIGNGWIEPRVQYSAHDVAYGHGLIGRSQRNALAEQEAQCQAEMSKSTETPDSCYDLLEAVVKNSQGRGSPLQVSVYDHRKWELVNVDRDFPPGHKDLEAYLGGRHGTEISNYEDVIEAIHSTPSSQAGQRYQECTDPPFYALASQSGLGVSGDIVALLDNGVKMLFFNGIHDLICNHIGNDIALENLEWKHQEDYLLAKRYGWKAPSTQKLAGYMKRHENLLYLKVLESGHMVPMDVPDVSLDMMRTLMYDNEFSFDSYEQRLGRAKQQDEACIPKAPCVVTECPVCTDACPEDKNSSYTTATTTTTTTGEKSTTKDNDDELEQASANLLVAGLVAALLCVLLEFAPPTRSDMELSNIPYYDEPGTI